MRAYVEGRRDKLSSHFIKGDTFDPLDGGTFIGGKTWGIHIPVLRQVDYAHGTQVNWLHPFFSLLFTFLYCVEDDLVDQLFHGSTVISKIDVRRLFLADMPVGNASTSNTFKQRIRQLSGVGKKIARRCRRIRANDEAIFKTSSVYDIDIGKGGTHRLCQGFYEAEITASTPGVDHCYTCRCEVGSYLAKEFNRGELEGHIGLLISIDTNHIVVLCCRLQVVAPVLHNHMQVGFIHMKILSPQVYNCTVDLNAIDRNGPIDGAKFSRDGSCSQSDYSHFAHLLLCEGWFVEIGCDQEIVSGALCKNLLWVVDGMNT